MEDNLNFPFEVCNLTITNVFSKTELVYLNSIDLAIWLPKYNMIVIPDWINKYIYRDPLSLTWFSFYKKSYNTLS